MTLTIPTLITAIKRHLSTIGKRLHNKEGKNLFSDITLSSAEETQILTQYINASVQDIESVLKQFITAAVTDASPSGSQITITINNTRGDDDFEIRTQDMAEAYITHNAVGEYLAMLHADLAQKYQRDAQQRLEALVGYVFYKKPPTAATATQPTATIS